MTYKWSLWYLTLEFKPINDIQVAFVVFDSGVQAYK